MPTKRRRRWPWFLGGAVLLVAALAVAIPFIYIHFIQGDPPAALTFENADANGAGATTSTSGSSATAVAAPTTTAAGAAPSATPAAAGAAVSATPAAGDGVDGTWKVTSGSQAGYRVKEVLFGQSTEAVGRTSDVTGSLTIAGTTVTNGSFSVDMTTVASDEGRRDSQFQGRIMETSKFPTATFELTKPIDLGNLPADKAQVTYTASGRLTLHGVTKDVDVAITARRNGANLEVSGTIPVVFADYGIDNPSSAGITTEDHGVVEFLLVFAQG